MKTVIMAGGLGTRIRSVAPNIPKPMIPVGGKPVLEHNIICLRDQGFADLILTVSHMAGKIIDYFGNGQRLGVHIEYYEESQPLGNAGALFKLRNQLTDPFLLLNGDSVFDIDFHRLIAYHNEKNALVTLFTHPNSHPYDSGVLITDQNNAVISWLAKEDPRPEWYANRVNAGIHVIDPRVLDMSGIRSEDVGTSVGGNPIKVDLDRQILKPLCGSGRMYCYNSPEYVKDMGTPERYKAVCSDFDTGKVHERNLRNKQRAVFLDRDGTINRYVGFLRNIDDFVLVDGAAEAIRRINNSGYLAIVVTNQPVIARGEVTEAQLRRIHDKMESLLGKEGAYLDAVYYCPHHPDKGFEGEVPELKINCKCRKPKPGMLLDAASEFNIDLSRSWMVGDSRNDILAGKAAGCRTALIGSEDYSQDCTVSSLMEFSAVFQNNR